MYLDFTKNRRLLNINNASLEVKREAINRWAFNKMQITGRGDRLSRIAVNKAIFADRRRTECSIFLYYARGTRQKDEKKKEKKNTKREEKEQREREREKKKKVDRGNSV